MNRTSEYLISDGKFFRRDIQTYDLGPQEDVILRMMDDMGGVPAPSVAHLDTEFFYHRMENEKLIYQKEKWRLNVSLFCNRESVTAFVEVPFIPISCNYHFNIHSQYGPLVLPYFSSRGLGLYVEEENKVAPMTLKMPPMEGDQFFVAVHQNYEGYEDENGNVHNYPEIYLFIVRQKKTLRKIGITNIYNDGKVCMGDEWYENNEEGILMEVVKNSLDQLFHESWSEDLLDTNSLYSMLWNPKTLGILYNDREAVEEGIINLFIDYQFELSNRRILPVINFIETPNMFKLDSSQTEIEPSWL